MSAELASSAGSRFSSAMRGGDSEDYERGLQEGAREVTAVFRTAKVYKPLITPSRYKGAYGGRGSAKSWFFADLLIKYVLEAEARGEALRAVCIREVQNTLEQSVKQLLEDRIKYHGLTGAFRILNTSIETERGSIVIFKGMQAYTADNIKSLEGFDVAWVEEAQTLSQRSLDLLRPTIRKAGSELWFSWNPRRPDASVDQFFRGADGPPPDSIVVCANYGDNPWFPEVLRKEMEWDRAHDPEKYRHIWLGDYEMRGEARVFKNWRVVDFETPQNAEFFYGGDFGFANDPTVLVRCWVKGRTLYVDREAYKVGCEIDHTPALFDAMDDGQARQWVITADSARPETISYLKRHGYPRIESSIKGAGSVKEGVAFLQNFNIVVHPRCKHTIDELTCYSYKTDKLTERVLPVLEDKKNHVIDALRYAVEKNRRSGGGFAVW